MSAALILTVLIAYFLLLFAISWFTGRKADNSDFFLGGRESPWYLVAFGMIGASLSGVTFISVPGKVGQDGFTYMQVVFGYLVGYFVVALVLLPLYYRMGLTSIYSYLNERFGWEAYRIGSVYFLLSRTLGAAIRLLLVASVLQFLIFDEWGVPFWVTASLSILLIWLYTNKGGIRTIVWTDTLQTAFMLGSLVLTMVFVWREVGPLSSGGMVSTIQDSGMGRMFDFGDINGGGHFLKSFIGGMFITIGMTGLDQDMMQKNLSCRNIGDAKKNMLSMATVLVIVNLLFLALGALLFLYSEAQDVAIPMSGETARTDLLFSEIALNQGLPHVLGVFFLLGLVAAAYSSADSALTALTTSVCIDLLRTDRRKKKEQERIRKRVHVIMSVVLLLVIILLNASTSMSAIWQIIFFAGFTYGPLIGLFFFGIITKRYVKGRYITIVSVLIPLLLGLYIHEYGKSIGDYQIGAELIFYNAVLVFGALFALSVPAKQSLSTNEQS